MKAWISDDRDEWISVKDGQPPQDGSPFLCYDPSQIDNFPEACIYVVRYQKGGEYWAAAYREAGGECYFCWEPTHWMPLPPPPKIKEEESSSTSRKKV